MTPSTEAVIQSHLRAARVGVDAVMEDFAEDSVLITSTATYRGLAEIRRFFTELFATLPKGFADTVALLRLEAVGEVGYIHWTAMPSVAAATDTFVVRGGKIRFQTFTSFPADN